MRKKLIKKSLKFVLDRNIEKNYNFVKQGGKR